jgi:hypothetical protein
MATSHQHPCDRFAAEGVVRVLTGQPPMSPVNAGDLVEARWWRTP